MIMKRTDRNLSDTREVEGFLVSKNFDRFFLIFLLIGGIGLFAILPIVLLLVDK